MPKLTVLTEMPPSARAGAESQIDELRTYVIRMQQELEYLLTHLDEMNISDDLLRRLLAKDGTLDAGQVTYNGDTINNIIVNEEEPGYLDTTDYWLDSLSTSIKIRKYILKDTSDLQYIRIQNGMIQFIAATAYSTAVQGLPDGTEQVVNRRRQRLYWSAEPVSHLDIGYPLDKNGKIVYIGARVTSWPVWVYKYNERVMAQFRFPSGVGNDTPQITLGEVSLNGRNMGYVFKDDDDFLIRYVTSDGSNCELVLGDDGYVEIRKLRRATQMDFSHFDDGYITETLDGGVFVSYSIDFDDGVPVRIYDGSNSCELIW